MLRATLRQLTIFQAVAERLSFTRAAEHLHLSQPAVSMQVKQLEENLGMPLFEQLGRSIHLTEAGAEVYRYGRAVNRHLAELDQVLNDLKGVSGGRLRIAVASTANQFAARLLASFSRRHPGVALSLQVTNRQSLVALLEANDCDLVIMGRPPEGLDVEAEAFLDNPLVVIASPQHRWAGISGLSPESLAEEAFVVRETGSGTRAAMERFFTERGVEVEQRMEFSSNEALKQAVAANLGLGLVSEHTIGLELVAGRLLVLPVEGFPIMRHWYVVHRRGKRLSPAAEQFRNFVIAESPSLVEYP